jgi:tetratricopeptide (TPR) repeat protein
MSFFGKLFGRGGPDPGDPPENAKQLFNDGVAASLNVSELLSSGDVEVAREQSRRAIDQFRAALELAPKSPTFAGALGHELYVNAATFGGGDFAEAADWLLKATRTEPDNVAFICDLGLCRANLGDLPGAQETFQRVLELDDSHETRDHVAMELGDIGQRAFDYGTSLQKEGKEQEGISYKRFAIGASMLAYRTLEVRRNLARQVSIFAQDIGDIKTADQYAALASE